MPYVSIDENRFMTGYSKWDNIGYLVDCICPDRCCSLKEDYESFSGNDQWEFSVLKMKEVKKAELASYRWDITYSSVDGLIPVSYINGFPIFQTLESRQRLELVAQALIRKGTPEIDTYRFKSVDGSWTDVIVGDVLNWSGMFAETEQVMYEQEEVIQGVIDALSTTQEVEAFNIITELDSLVKPILSADLTNYSYPIKYYNEDNA